MQKVVYKNTNIPIKLWVNDIEPGALEQAIHLANLPFAFKHIAIMPDAHQGYGMPIGGVLALDNIIIPNAVGVDIGCGMRAVKTPFIKIDTKTIKDILKEIKEAIPIGPNHHKENQDGIYLPARDHGKEYPIIEEQFNSALKQIGTLGGGNHFIEIQKGSDGYIWIMLHSGSRNIGKRVADYHNKIAKKLNKKWYTNVDSTHGLAFLPFDSEEGKCYWREMLWCVQFAKENRNLMMLRILNIISNYTEPTQYNEFIDIAHNYADWENHFNKNVIVHRKGATRARAGDIGIIPGSQGTKSYIVKGLGNPESFMSCSHGAGRTMSRSKARKVLSLKEEKKKLEDKGIIHAIKSMKDLDEASGAYKDINVVMENQKDLVEIVTELTPLAVVKG